MHADRRPRVFARDMRARRAREACIALLEYVAVFACVASVAFVAATGCSTRSAPHDDVPASPSSSAPPPGPNADPTTDPPDDPPSDPTPHPTTHSKATGSLQGGSPAPGTFATTGTACATKLHVGQGDTFAAIARRCYGSRTYQDWIIAHTHHASKPLRAGETIDLPPFATLVDEQLAAKWKPDAPRIVDAFVHFRLAEGEIEASLHAAAPGAAEYVPSAAAKKNLEAAAADLRPFVARLLAAKVRTQKFSQLVETFDQLASGAGSFSTDYATEDVHQCFFYGVHALR